MTFVPIYQKQPAAVMVVNGHVNQNIPRFQTTYLREFIIRVIDTSDGNRDGPDFTSSDLLIFFYKIYKIFTS